MFAHSLRFVFPRITAPASRNLCATVESLGACEPSSAKEPAVVIILSAVSMLSLIRIGIPCSGPRGPLSLRSLSIASAIDGASGFSSMIALRAGPCLSIASMRARYFSVIEREVYFPDFMPSCKSEMVISSSSNAGTSPAKTTDFLASATSPATSGFAAAVAIAAVPSKDARKNSRRAGAAGVGCSAFTLSVEFFSVRFEDFSLSILGSRFIGLPSGCDLGNRVCADEIVSQVRAKVRILQERTNSKDAQAIEVGLFKQNSNRFKPDTPAPPAKSAQPQPALPSLAATAGPLSLSNRYSASRDKPGGNARPDIETLETKHSAVSQAERQQPPPFAPAWSTILAAL